MEESTLSVVVVGSSFTTMIGSVLERSANAAGQICLTASSNEAWGYALWSDASWNVAFSATGLSSASSATDLPSASWEMKKCIVSTQAPW